MQRRSVAVSLVPTAITLVLLGKTVRAAEPTTAQCLAASDASLRAGGEHRLRAERSHLLICAASSCPADIRKECTRRVDEVTAAIPTIVFEAKDGAGNDLSAVKVTMDGEVLAERLEGSALSIDPGQHTFSFETAGQLALSKQFVIRESQKDRRESISFGSPAASPLVKQSIELAPSTSDTVERRRGLGTQRIAAIVVGGIGVVGLGVGAAFGLMAMSKKTDANNVCPNECADQDGVTKWSDAKSAGNVSTIAFIVGGVAVAGASALWFTAKPAQSSSAQVGFGLGGLQLRGTW